MGNRMGRESVKHLALTGGAEHEKEVGAVIQYAPSAVVQVEKAGGEGGWRSGGRGRELATLSAGSREGEVRRLETSKELGKMMKEGETSMVAIEEIEEGKEDRESDEKGVSMEGEYAFTKAVGDFCREGVREGSYKGSYILNIREQMEERVRRNEGEGRKRMVLFVGGSQMGRLMREVRNVGHQVVSECVWIKVRGELNDEEAGRVLNEVREMEVRADTVIFGGPGNSLVKHGKSGSRGHHPERVVTVEKNGKGEVVRMGVRYHMTEPARVTMTERRELADRMVKLMEGVTEEVRAEEGVYVTMFPRHVEKCCGREGHMTDGDCLTMASVRRDLDRDVKDELRDKGGIIRHMDWWRLLKLDGEGTVREVASKGIVDRDGVHLTVRMNRTAAVSICHRMMEGPMEEDWSEASTSSKRPRMN
jgi:hypothetical protein